MLDYLIQYPQEDSTMNSGFAEEVEEEVFYLVGSVKDPERQPSTLHELGIIGRESISYSQADKTITIQLLPTTPKCHLMQQIGLSVYCRLQEQLSSFNAHKLRIVCRQGSHNDHQAVNKLLNDKERVAAALQNEEISKFIHSLLQ